jgi:hypothetical protein
MTTTVADNTEDDNNTEADNSNGDPRGYLALCYSGRARVECTSLDKSVQSMVSRLIETSLLLLNKDYQELLSHQEEYLNGDKPLGWLVLFALAIKFEGKRFCCHSAFLLCSASIVRTSNNKLYAYHAYFGPTSS